jgi:hypothetical protein
MTGLAATATTTTTTTTEDAMTIEIGNYETYRKILTLLTRKEWDEAKRRIQENKRLVCTTAILTNMHGSSFANIAVSCNMVDFLDYLLGVVFLLQEQEQDPSLRQKIFTDTFSLPGTNGMRPLDSAIFYGSLECLVFLIEHTSPAFSFKVKPKPTFSIIVNGLETVDYIVRRIENGYDDVSMLKNFCEAVTLPLGARKTPEVARYEESLDWRDMCSKSTTRLFRLSCTPVPP